MPLRVGRSRLPELLKRKGMTQAEFARRMNKTESYVSQIVNGKSKFSVTSLKKAAIILGVSMDELYEWETNGNR